MSKFSLALACAVLAFGALSAQEAISHNSLFAVGDLSGKWTYRAETHFVRGDFMKQSRQLILRPAFIYKLSKSIRLSGGLSYLYNASYEGGPFNTNEEINFWEQIDFSHQVGSHSLFALAASRATASRKWVYRKAPHSQSCRRLSL